MNQERILQVLLSPHVSEKASRVADKMNQHVFHVAVDADKREVKQAVEQMFNVKVAKVQILNTKGKTKRFGSMTGRRSNWKKAVVRLETGHDINFAGAEA